MKPALVSVPPWRPLLRDLLAVTPSHKAGAFRGLMEGAVAFEKGERGGVRLMLKHARELRQLEVAREAAARLIAEFERIAPTPSPEKER